MYIEHVQASQGTALHVLTFNDTPIIQRFDYLSLCYRTFSKLDLPYRYRTPAVN